MEFVTGVADLLGESPLWDERLGALFWIDIDGKRVRRLDDDGTVSSRPVGGRPGSIALTPSSGHLLMAAEHEAGWFDWESGAFTPWVGLEPPGTGNRLNDGSCDRGGRFWVGSMFERASARRFTGFLHRLDPDGTVTTFDDGVGVANATAFSPEGDVMYFADTLHRVVWAFDYDSATGKRANRRVLNDFTVLPGGPDGACVDADGCLWVACVGGWAVARLSPDGAVDRVVEMPVEKPTMPCFGGSGLDVLYVTSIGKGSSSALTTPERQPGAGRLLAGHVGTVGLLEPRFGADPLERSNGPG